LNDFWRNNFSVFIVFPQIQIGDIYTQVIEAYDRRTAKGGKTAFNSNSNKYNNNRFQMTAIINGNIVNKKQFKHIRDAQRQLIKDQETKPVLQEQMFGFEPTLNTGFGSNMKKAGYENISNSGECREQVATGDSQRLMAHLRKRSNMVKKHDPMQSHSVTQNERTREWVKRNVSWIDESNHGYKRTPVMERRQLVPR